MNLKDRIQDAELKSVALAKAVSEHQQELAKLQQLASAPTPRVRRNLKAKRLAEITEFYTKRQIKKIAAGH